MPPANSRPATAMPGVVAVFTGDDLARDGIGDIPCVSGLSNRDKSTMWMPPRPALVQGRVRHVGDTVAMVVAETASAARDAAEAIIVDYEMLPAVVNSAHAGDSGQPTVSHACPSNIVYDCEGVDDPAEIT